MKLLNILHFPDNRLRKKGKNIAIYDDNLNTTAMNMLHTMYESKGIGLALSKLIYK
jgi:peptide deformylase